MRKRPLRTGLAGLGLAQLFETMVAQDVAAGRLLPVLDAYTPPFPGFYIYYPARRQLAPKLRAFVEFMCQGL